MAKKTAIRRSNQLSLFMYIMILTCDFVALEEGILSYLTRWTPSALDNSSHFSFSMDDLVVVSGGRRK